MVEGKPKVHYVVGLNGWLDLLFANADPLIPNVMCKGILMIERPKVINLTEARTIRKVHCGECNWEQEIAAITEAEIKCCPWCGWSDLEISTLKAEGGFQEIECQKHGRVTVLLPSCNIDPLDFMNNLFCPFCE